METAPIAILQHVACFLPPSSRVALACSSRRLHQAAALAPASSSCSVDRWRFLACFEKSAARPLRWKCWLPDAKTERRLLHAALRRYQAFLLRKSTAPTPHFDGTESPPPAIPRVIHQIWLGSPLPDRFEAWRASYRTLHPEWEHRLWTEAEVAKTFPEGLRNQAAFDAAPNFGEKADILRYEVLHRFGGLYVDVDMECLLPHDALHSREGGCLCYAGFSHTGTVELNNGVIGSAPAHPLLAALIERIHAEHHARQEERRRREQEQAQRQARLAATMGFLGEGDALAVQGVVAKAEGHQAAMATIERTGPGLFTRVCADYLLSAAPSAGDSDNEAGAPVLLLPPQWFYALPNTEAAAVPSDGAADEQRRALFVAPGVTHAVHHWARSWQAQS